MRIDRNSRLQIDRIDRQKSNRWKILDYLPTNAENGDMVYLVDRVPRHGREQNGTGWIWLVGRWRPLTGLTAGDIDDIVTTGVPGEDVFFSTEIQPAFQTEIGPQDI